MLVEFGYIIDDRADVIGGHTVFVSEEAVTDSGLLDTKGRKLVRARAYPMGFDLGWTDAERKPSTA